jgi:hypothetical protein
MAARFQQCLHRAMIDMSLVNRVARKIWKTGAWLGWEQNPYSVVYAFSLTPCFSQVCITGWPDQNRFSGFPEIQQAAEAV